MQVLLDNIYQTLSYDPDKSLIKQLWKQGSIDLNDENYKSELILYVEIIEKYQPTKILVNIQNLMYAITPGVQIWTINNIVLRVVNAEPEKQAFVVPKNFPVNITKDQNEQYDDDMDLGINIRYYENEEEALKWILT